jgi:hypothetical protein
LRVGFDAPRGRQLPARLSIPAQRRELSIDVDALAGLPNGCFKVALARIDHPFWDRPGAFVLLRLERAAGINE